MAKDPYRYFRVEARDLLDKLSGGAMELEKGQGSRELIRDLLRLAHTLKGAARVVREPTMAEFAHVMEELLDPYREGDIPVPRETAAQLLRLVDACGERFRSLLPPAERAADSPGSSDSPEPFTSVRVDIADLDAMLYELVESGVQFGALSLESARLDRAMRRLDQVLARLAVSVSGPAVMPGNGYGSAAPDVRVMTEEVRAGLRHYQQSLQARIRRTQQDFSDLRERASELRLLPAREIFPFLERAVRDAAESLRKQVAFVGEGGEHRLDAHVLLAVRDALLHVVRNAVAHGIESDSERVLAGKPATGTVRLHIRRQGAQVAFLVEDDGRGLDLPAIRESLVRRGLLSSAQAGVSGMADISRFLLQGGTTTTATVSEVSGRGVGLDVVRSTVARLSGTVSLNSEPGRGISLEMIVPVSLELMTVVVVCYGETWAFLPFGSVRQVLRFSENDLVRSPEGTSMIVEDQPIRFQPLQSILTGPQVRKGAPRNRTAVILQSGAIQVAVGVDRLGGIRNVVVRPLPVLCGLVPLISGAVMDEEGNPQLVLDPAAIADKLHTTLSPVAVVEPAAPLPVLVVDDSLTTRMLEQSILEAAGCQVDLATCGEEALEKARRRKYSLFVVDVEMPGISGFELLELFRADPNLSSIPAILVTSRSAPEDRLRGEQAGARAYIVKGEFHEGHLLRTIRELVGEMMP
jgi:two-component system, chemotaxis family, sensor kinase CheA